MDFSPDGATLASGSEDKSIKLWDVETGREKAMLKGHSDMVYSVSFNPNGAILASGGGYKDNTVKLWDVATARENASFKGRPDTVYGDGVGVSVCFSPDGATFASGSLRSIRMWEVTTGREKTTVPGKSLWARSVSFSPDGGTFAVVINDMAILGTGGYIDLWDLATGRAKARLKLPRWVESVTFSPDSATLASGGYDDGVKLWDVATGREKAMFKGHSRGVASVRFSPDGATLASAGSRDKAVRLWNVPSGREIATLTGHSDNVNSVSFSPDGLTLASGSSDNTIKLWDMTTEPITMEQAIRLTDAQLKGFEVVPLSADAYTVRQDFVAMNDFSFAPSSEPPLEENPFLKIQWSERNPNHWLPGARRGEAKVASINNPYNQS